MTSIIKRNNRKLRAVTLILTLRAEINVILNMMGNKK